MEPFEPAAADAPPPPDALFEDPALLPFLPMVYVAWADGDLSASEIEEISSRLAKLGHLGAGPLGRWLDPSRPPSACDLARLLGRIRREAGVLAVRERLSLTELGLAGFLHGVGLSRTDQRVVEALELEASLQKTNPTTR